MTASTEDDAAPSTDIELVPIDIQAGLRAAFKTYYDSLSKNVHRGRTVRPAYPSNHPGWQVDH